MQEVRDLEALIQNWNVSIKSVPSETLQQSVRVRGDRGHQNKQTTKKPKKTPTTTTKTRDFLDTKELTHFGLRKGVNMHCACAGLYHMGCKS